MVEKLKLFKPVINCETNVLRLKLGKTATFRCNITVGDGDLQSSDVHVEWKKVRLL